MGAKLGLVETQLMALREARWRELHEPAKPRSCPPMSNKMSNWTDLSVDKCPSVDIKPVDMVDTRKPVVKDVASWRERKHIHENVRS